EIRRGPARTDAQPLLGQRRDLLPAGVFDHLVELRPDALERVRGRGSARRVAGGAARRIDGADSLLDEGIVICRGACKGRVRGVILVVDRRKMHVRSRAARCRRVQPSANARSLSANTLFCRLLAAPYRPSTRRRTWALNSRV